MSAAPKFYKNGKQVAVEAENRSEYLWLAKEP